MRTNYRITEIAVSDYGRVLSFEMKDNVENEVYVTMPLKDLGKLGQVVVDALMQWRLDRKRDIEEAEKRLEHEQRRIDDLTTVFDPLA